MSEQELINKISEISQGKKDKNIHPSFVTLKELSLVLELKSIREPLSNLVDKDILIKGDTINDKYYLIPE